MPCFVLLEGLWPILNYEFPLFGSASPMRIACCLLVSSVCGTDTCWVLLHGGIVMHAVMSLDTCGTCPAQLNHYMPPCRSQQAQESCCMQLCTTEPLLCQKSRQIRCPHALEEASSRRRTGCLLNDECSSHVVVVMVVVASPHMLVKLGSHP